MSLTQEILPPVGTAPTTTAPEPFLGVDPTLVELAGGQRLLVERGAQNDFVTLVAPTGQVTLSIRITPAGPILQCQGGLKVEATGPLELAGRSVAIRGLEGVTIESGGDAQIDVAGDLSTTARIQHIQARLGNVNVKANDDVRLRGERIRLNC
jgi:hypothetical protein